MARREKLPSSDYFSSPLHPPPFREGGRGVGLVAALLFLLLLGCARGTGVSPVSAPPPAPTPVAAPAPAPASPPGPAAVKPIIFSRLQTDQPLVALTFDCCQTAKPAGFDRPLVDVLLAHHTPATFMLGGRWMETHPEATRLLAATPYFELGNHSYLHPHMAQLDAAHQLPELTRPQEIMHQQVARYALFFRPPYGEWNQSLVDQSAAAGMYTVMWTISTGDPDRHATVADLLGEFHKVKPGAIVLMHANGRGWKTAQALPQMLDYLRAKHLRPVTLHDLWQSGAPVPATEGKS